MVQSFSMLEQNAIHRIHLIGVCGTAMASLAAMLKDRGYDVSGSDEGIYPPMSDFLAEKRIRVITGYNIGSFDPEPDLVIIGNSQSRGNPEIEYVLNFRVPYLSLPEAIKQFFLRDRLPIVVTGTHGKTTTTSMIAWVLHAAGMQPNFLIGGIAENFHSSYGLEGGKHFIIEGDEYDSAFFDKGPKFLHYMPQTAIVGNVEFDHADIYPNLDAIRVQFSRFVNLIPQRGYLAVGADSPAALEVTRDSHCVKETFGLAPEHDWSARNIDIKADRQNFEVLYKEKLFRRYRLPVHGAYNIRNALAATAVLHRLGISEDDIRDGMESFAGVKRRLQLRAEVAGIRIFEDFAHHPTAVRETLEAVRGSFHPKRLWAIYEPRSATSRRKVFQHEIGDALGRADLIVMPTLFKPEKVPEAERLDLGRLLADLNRSGRTAWNMPSVEDIIRKVCDEARAGDVIVILSNGGFGGIYEKLPAALETRSPRS